MLRVTHFEISTDQPDRAIKFYTDVFGWDIRKWEGPTEYWMIMTGEEGQPGIDGGLMRRTHPSVGAINFVEVPSVDDFISKIKEHGGKILAPKMTIPSIGYEAYCEDTEGNVFGIFQEDLSAR